MVKKASPQFDPGFDELQLFEAMLNDPFINHDLLSIVKKVQIQRLTYPDDLGEYPGIRLYTGGWRSVDFGAEVSDNEEKIDVWKKIIVAEIYMMDNQKVKYFNKVFSGAENGLTVIRDIVYRIIAEQQGYSNDDFPGIEFGIIYPEAEVWRPQYLNIADAKAVVISFAVEAQKTRLGSDDSD